MLTERESQVIQLIAEGLGNKEIADRLDISVHTAKFHIRNTFKKMGVTTRTKAAMEFVRLRAVTP